VSSGDAPLFGEVPHTVAESLFTASLPQARCNSCRTLIQRRDHRVMLRATWRPEADVLCRDCWYTVCEWATRFCLQQIELPY
jgi:hypothetical protein